MPYKNKADRNYRREYEQYNGKPEQIKKRSENNKARRIAKAAGMDIEGKDVDHVKPLSKGGTNAVSNLRAKPASKNRSFSRNSDHTVKKNAPKK